jgi:Ser/Thr protein kinase RdoA (MazF antagonist)
VCGARPRYELLHGHINSGNFVVGADGCWLIDFDAVRFGDFAQDLVRALNRLTEERPERQSVLERAYFAHFDGSEHPTPEEFARLRPFYEADFHVSRAVGMRRKELRGEHGPDHTQAMVERAVTEAQSVLASA